jgi:hypothetical protein
MSERPRRSVGASAERSISISRSGEGTDSASSRRTISLSAVAPAVRGTGPAEPATTPGPDHDKRATPADSERSKPCDTKAVSVSDPFSNTSWSSDAPPPSHLNIRFVSNPGHEGGSS